MASPSPSSSSEISPTGGRVAEMRAKLERAAASAAPAAKVKSSPSEKKSSDTPPPPAIPRKTSSSNILSSGEKPIKAQEVDSAVETPKPSALKKASSFSDHALKSAQNSNTTTAMDNQQPSLPKSSSAQSLTSTSSLRKNSSLQNLTSPPPDPAALPTPPQQPTTNKIFFADTTPQTQQPLLSPASKILLPAIDFTLPPTIDEQDFVVLWALSFVIPFFALRFVFLLVKRCILTPARYCVRFAPGATVLLALIYSKLGPQTVKMVHFIKQQLPPMDSLNALARQGFDNFLAKLQVASASAWPHLVHVAHAVQNLKFREAAYAAYQVMRASAPMFGLILSYIPNILYGIRDFTSGFAKFSKTAVYAPFGALLRGMLHRFGQALTENPDVFAQSVAGLIGPIIVANILFVVIIGILLSLGLVDYQTLNSFYIAWFFRLIGMVTEPSLLQGGEMSAGDFDSSIMIGESAASFVASGAATTSATTTTTTTTTTTGDFMNSGANVNEKGWSW